MNKKTQITKKCPEPQEADAKSEWAKALATLTRYLALRDHSVFELKCKLERCFAPELVQKLLAQAEQKNWLPTPEEISERVVVALTRRFKSQTYIEAQLHKKHLPLPLDQGPTVEIERIRHLLGRKYGARTLSYEEKAKAYTFLKYRGFHDSAIRQVLNEE